MEAEYPLCRVCSQSLDTCECYQCPICRNCSHSLENCECNPCPTCNQISRGACDCGTKICRNVDCSMCGKYYHYDDQVQKCVRGHDLSCSAYSEDNSSYNQDENQDENEDENDF